MKSKNNMTTQNVFRHAASRMLNAKHSASREQSGARSCYAEAQPVFAGTAKPAPPHRP